MNYKYVVRDKVREYISDNITEETIGNAVATAMEKLDWEALLHEALVEKISDMVEDVICDAVSDAVEEEFA